MASTHPVRVHLGRGVFFTLLVIGIAYNPSMSGTDYEAILGDTLAKLGAIGKEIERLEVEAAKLKQFFTATLNMLPDDARSEYVALFRQMGETAAARETSLKRAIHHVLLAAYPQYLTVAEIRDRLEAAAFDFSDYKSNPLASISTTLRRAKSQEIKSTQIENVTAFRMRKNYIDRIRKLARRIGPTGTLSDMNPKNELPPPGHAARPKGVFARARERAQGKLSDMNSTLTPPPKLGK